MRILFIISDLQTGGAETQIYKVVECIHSQHEVQVISLVSVGEIGCKIAALGVPVEAIGMSRGFPFGLSFFGLIKKIKKYQPDVVHTWMYHANLAGGLAAVFAGVKNIIWSIHQYDTTRRFNTSRTLMVIKAGAIFSRWIPRKIVCVSGKVMESHVAYGYDARKMTVIPNGIDTVEFHFIKTARASVMQTLSLTGDILLVGFFCRYNPIKDHAGFLRAFAKLKQQEKFTHLHVIMAGSDVNSSNRKLMEVINDLGISPFVHLLGNRHDIPALMSSVDLFVSASFNEAFSLVLAEAMACTIPCISTIDGDPAGIVKDHGKLVPAGDPDAMAEAMIKMFAEMENPEKWVQLKTGCREHIRNNYSLHNIVERYAKIWVG